MSKPKLKTKTKTNLLKSALFEEEEEEED